MWSLENVLSSVFGELGAELVRAWDGLYTSETLRRNFEALEEGLYLLKKGFSKSDLTGFANQVDNIFPSTKSTLVDRIGSGNGFDLIHTDAQLQAILLRAESLKLPQGEIDDLLYVSCRQAKPISSKDLVQQMDNWVNVVKVRGYPYRFSSLSEFQQFGQSLKGKLDAIGVNTSDVRVQGSSLRTPNANDVDLAVLVSDIEFNNFLRNGFGNNNIKDKITNTFIDITNMTDSELLDLALRIQNDSSNTLFNAKARTFANAFMSRKISAKTKSPEIILGINNLKNAISSDYPNLNIEDVSTMTPGGGLDLKPFINL